ncbi:hypothetical protein [Natronorubrum bangense]|uniref:Uncharacterized protein n=2 Tax=Natronorubrum bangense TaxID=61858 RepID=L9WCP9_9EURY|nr:hypothetical protein [Natronorubrum bangense]ELY47026.1 hypothetical protein C494_14066 [Natronorubrum bangense JCM 10635]QCC56391.1 hypothetical protein DV706_17840 [Natronorubrum bangense]
MKFLPKSERSTDEPSDQTADRDESTDHPKSRRTTYLQGAAVFVVMFVTLWWLLSRGEEQTE